MAPAQRILETFREAGVSAGARVHKRVILDAIKSTGMDMNDVRNGWHQLMGEGLIRQMGEELELTARGGALLYGSES